MWISIFLYPYFRPGVILFAHMSFEHFGPSGEQWNLPKKIRAEVAARAEEAGVTSEQFNPKDAQASLDQYRATMDHELVHDFGMPEIPKQILAEMEYVVHSVENSAEHELFQEESSKAVVEKLRLLAVKISHYKEEPIGISVTAVPEEGFIYSYKRKDGTEKKGILNADEQDLAFQLEMWADRLVQLKNIDQFKQMVKTLTDRAKSKPESERGPFIESQLEQKYRQYGFTSEQIKSLLVLSEHQDVKQFEPEGEKKSIDKLRIMKSVWEQYLSSEEKTQYLKFAAGMIVTGAVEGIAPTLLGKSVGSTDLEMSALFALGYIGMEVGVGWVNRKLTVEFDTLLNEIMQKENGLNQKLAKDLVYQPGEKMMRAEERGRLMSTIERSQNAFRDVMGSMAKSTAPAIATTAVGLGFMMANDWKLGLISLASAPIAVAIGRRTEKKLRPIIRQTYKNESVIAQEVQEQMAAHQDIVLGGQREQMAEHLSLQTNKGGELAHARTVAHEDLRFQTQKVLNAGIVGGLTVAGAAMRQLGIPDAQNLVSAIVYSGMFRNSFNEIVYANNHLLESLQAITEMEEVFNGYAKAEIEEDKYRVGASLIKEFSIDVNDISLVLDGKPILDHVSFQVPAGGVVRLEGRSGAGKTTMSRLMSGYFQSTSGEVSIGGFETKDVKKTGPESLYKHIAYLSQHPYIFESGDLRANLAFGNETVDENSMKQVLQELGLAKRFRSAGEISLESKVRGLSGGEKARLGLARVLLKIRSQENGGVLFLDQATEELDEETEKEIAALLRAEKKRRPNLTVVIISHRNDFIRELEQGMGGEKLKIQRVRLESAE